MAQFHAGTPSAWARLSKHGGLDINSIPRDEAEDLIVKIAALEDQLNESESNYEKLYAEYEKAKTYYQDIEASIEAATETYLAEKGQFLVQQETDAATIAELQSQLEEERKAKELAQSQLSAAKGQLRQVQEEAAAAKQAQQKLTKEHETALKDYSSTQNALEKAEARAVAAQEVARAAEEAASLRIALADQMERAAKEAAKAVEKREAALGKEETKVNRALEEREKKLAKREAELDNLLATYNKNNEKAYSLHLPTGIASPTADGADGASPSGISPKRKVLAALRAPTASKRAATEPNKKNNIVGGRGARGSGKQASKMSISDALFLEPISSNKATVSDQQPARRLAVKMARKANNGIEEEEEVEAPAFAAAAVAGPSGRSRGRASTAPRNTANKSSTATTRKAAAAAAAAPRVKKTTATKKTTSTARKKTTAVQKNEPNASDADATVATRTRGRPRKNPAIDTTGNAEMQPAALTTSTTTTMVTAVENVTVTRSGRVSKALSRGNGVATSTRKGPASKKSTRSKDKVLAV